MRANVVSILLAVSSSYSVAQSNDLPSSSHEAGNAGSCACQIPKGLKARRLLILAELTSDIPTNELSKAVQNPIVENGGATRSAKDAQLYQAISPSVVYVANKEGFGSGSLLDNSGNI